MREPAIVPELSVTDIAASLAFWCGPCGFRIRYDRPEHGFAFLEREGGACVMLDQRGVDRDWETGRMERPFGRGINLEIGVAAVHPILDALAAAGWPLFMPPETKTYRVGDGAVSVLQFLVQDPDGYLLRFSEGLAGG
jgi:catechol 2,3-dioxygenase-like lactoylglutathione lyase family enzyme